MARQQAQHGTTIKPPNDMDEFYTGETCSTQIDYK